MVQGSLPTMRTMFLDPDGFDFVRTGWHQIRDEFSALREGRFVDWPEHHLHGGGWTVFGLQAFGQRVEENMALCPETARLVSAVPGLTTAGFSRLAPGTHIRPHVGYTDAVLRCHLGLVVPAEGCALRVGEETRPWEEGRCLVFDDTVEHEAWNRSSSDRIVLLLDFLRPGASPEHVKAPEAVADVLEQPG